MEAKPANTNNDKAELAPMNDKKDELSTKMDSGVVSMKSHPVSSESKDIKKKTLTTDKIEDNDAVEDLPEKRKHTVGEGCSLFPIHTWLFFLYIILAIILAVFGTLLIINGNWTNIHTFFENLLQIYGNYHSK